MKTHSFEISLAKEFDSLYEEAIKLDVNNNEKVNKNSYLYSLKQQAERQNFSSEKLK